MQLVSASLLNMDGQPRIATHDCQNWRKACNRKVEKGGKNVNKQQQKSQKILHLLNKTRC